MNSATMNRLVRATVCAAIGRIISSPSNGTIADVAPSAIGLTRSTAESGVKNTENTRQVNTGAMIALPKNFASQERRKPFTRARGREESTARARDTGRPRVISTGTTNMSRAIRVEKAQRSAVLQVPRNPNDTTA